MLTRAGLVSPHLTLLNLLWIPAQFAIVLAWFCALLAGRVPEGLHRFLAGVVRYQTRVAAYGLLLADPFPGFTGRTSYPFDVAFAGPQRHSRVRALFYLPIATLLAGGVVLLSISLILLMPLAWVACLFAGRMPAWIQRAGTWQVGFIAQSMAFGLLVTDRLPARARQAVEAAPWSPTPLPPARKPAPRGSASARVLGLAGAALMTAGAVAAGLALWHTTVPSNLTLPHLQASDYFGPDALADVHDQDRADLWFVISQAVSIVALVLFAWRGRRLARHSAAGPIGTGIFVGMLGVGWAAIASAPFVVLGVLALPASADAGPVGIEIPLEATAQMTNVAILLAIGMGLARKLPRRWWLAAVPALGALLAVSVLIAPALVSEGPKLKDPVLLADAHELAAREGIPDADIDYIDERDRGTDAPTPTNAFAVGSPTSAEVVLLGSLRSRRELRVMLGHEIAHVARNHSWRTAGWQVLFLLIGAVAVQLAVRRRGDLYNPALVPLALVVFSLVHFALTPLDTAASRRYEAEADWIALNATRDPRADIALMKTLAADNDAAPTRPWWSTAMLETHPAIMDRIEMAVAWRRRHPS